ncbi:MAG TPA: signal peptidase I [Acidimicrobiales bacterium]|nr:signal peptidase I [Acidimicrobiales bacterium]
MSGLHSARRRAGGPPADVAEPRATRRRGIAEDVALIAIAVAVAVVVRALVAQAYYIPSASMVPQLRVDDRVVVSRVAYHLHAPRRGDIVVFKAPPSLDAGRTVTHNPVGRFFRSIGVALGVTEDQTVLIKRVIALPGETVSGRGGRIYVGSEVLVEPYLPVGTLTSDFGPVAVPKGDIWVMGDNRGNSDDSRFFGPIPERTIVGRAIWKVWPPWRASFL